MHSIALQKPKQPLMKTTNIHKTKPKETESWLDRLLCHPARKGIGPILQLPGPAQGQPR